MSENAADGDRASSPWTQRGFIAAAVVVGLLVVLGVVLVLTNPGDDRADPPGSTTASSSAPPSTTSEAPDAEDSACGLPEGDQTVPATAPEGTEWELVGDVAAPTAPETHGPGEVNDGLRTCFARTPSGALYAAVNFFASTSEPELRQRAASELTASGAGRDRAIAEAAGSQPDSGGGVQVEGFTFLNYSEDAATVDLAFRSTRADGTSGLVHMPLSLVWETGDWRAALPPSGELFPGLGPVPDLVGYAPWAGA